MCSSDLGGALFIFAPEVSLSAYAHEVGESAWAFYESVGKACAWCVDALVGLANGRAGRLAAESAFARGAGNILRAAQARHGSGYIPRITP